MAKDEMKKGTKKKITKVAPSPYQVSLKVNNQELLGEGDSILNALNQLHPAIYKTVGRITVHQGDKSYERILFIPQMRRAFAFDKPNSVQKQFLAKWLTLGLK